MLIFEPYRRTFRYQSAQLGFAISLLNLLHVCVELCIEKLLDDIRGKKRWMPRSTRRRLVLTVVAFLFRDVVHCRHALHALHGLAVLVRRLRHDAAVCLLLCWKLWPSDEAYISSYGGDSSTIAPLKHDTSVVCPHVLLSSSDISTSIMVDYKGQALAERYMIACFVVICSPAWIYGYFQQDFTYPLYAWAAATVVAALVILPNWGMYNRHPIEWTPSVKYIKKASASKKE